MDAQRTAVWAAREAGNRGGGSCARHARRPGGPRVSRRAYSCGRARALLDVACSRRLLHLRRGAGAAAQPAHGSFDLLRRSGSECRTGSISSQGLSTAADAVDYPAEKTRLVCTQADARQPAWTRDQATELQLGWLWPSLEAQVLGRASQPSRRPPTWLASRCRRPRLARPR
jgi:hypothetical protein